MTTRKRLLFAGLAVLIAVAVGVPAGAWQRLAGSTPLGPAGSAAAAPAGPGNRAGAGGGSDPAGGQASHPGSCDGHPMTGARQLRGMWLTTVNNIDWPSRPGLDPETVRAEYRSWLDLAQRLNHNAVFVHVRPSGDALWPSKFAPWSEWLTGRRDGTGPGWDPMRFMIDEAHARNIEFHAWFNPYRGSQPAPDGAGPDLTALAPDHPLRQHADWAVVYPIGAAGSRLYYDPGIASARRFVEDSMLEAVTSYDIDGVHFDDFFYPYPAAKQDFGDDASFARYGAGFATKADWRRDNVNTLVREMSERIKAIKPWVKFGISPFGIWRNAASDPAGSPTRGLQSYDDIYADTRLWIKRQWLDYVVPQLYWQIGFDVADYAKLLPWWSQLVAGTRVQLYIGQADYRVGQSGAWSDPGELDRQLALNSQYPQVGGSVHFSAKSVRSDRLGSVGRYSATHYARPALIPTMGQLPAAPPAPPTSTSARRKGVGGVTLRWRAGSGTAAVIFAVYRVDGATAGGPATLIWTGRAAGIDQGFVDGAAPPPGTAATYCVVGLDRSWNEGAASVAHAVR